MAGLLRKIGKAISLNSNRPSLLPDEKALWSLSNGYDLTNPEDRKRSVTVLENLFFDLCASARSDLFIEAGAKDANASSRARSVLGQNARVVAFEANPYTYERFRLKPQMADNRVEYTHLALSDSEGTVTFNVHVIDGAEQPNGQGSIMPRATDDRDEKQVTVNAARLGQFFKGHEFRSASLWVDVEGANQKVLSGAEETLCKTDVMFIEVENKAYWDKQWLSSDVVIHLRQFGLKPVARDFQSRSQWNYLFVSDRLNANFTARKAIDEFTRSTPAGGSGA